MSRAGVRYIVGSTNRGVEDTKNYRTISTRRPRGAPKTRALRGNGTGSTLYHYWRKPQKIQTDQGTEFFNKHFKDLMKEEEIQLYNTYNETKASVVERVIRT